MPTEEQTYRENTKEKLEEILVQTKKTNGRVGKLELWQNRVLGFCAAVSILLLPVLYLVLEKKV